MRYVGIEGPDGCGKSTLVASVSALLRLCGLRVHATQEPGGNPLGARIRALLKDPEVQAQTTPMARRVLFEADRINQQRVLYNQLMNDGATNYVISDRLCPVSNTAYGVGEGSADELVRRVEAIDPQRMLPELVVLVDLPLEVGWSRRKKDGVDPAEKDRAMYERVCGEYQKMVRRAAGARRSCLTISGYELPAIVVDGTKSPARLAAETALGILQYFGDSALDQLSELAMGICPELEEAE